MQLSPFELDREICRVFALPAARALRAHMAETGETVSLEQITDAIARMRAEVWSKPNPTPYR